MQSVIDWLASHKAVVGIMTALGGLGMYNGGCPGAEPICQKIAQVAMFIGAFLAGGGLMNSDKQEKFEQLNEKTKPQVEKQTTAQGGK